MATIGLDKLYYAPITEAPGTGEETYGTPVKLAGLIKVGIAVDVAEAKLFTDDKLDESIREFTGGKFTLQVKDIGGEHAAVLTGATLDDNGVLISAGEDGGKPVALGFRAKKSNGKYRYFWIYKVKFSVPNTDLDTKGDNVKFQTPTIEGDIMARNKPALDDKHPWKAEVDEDAVGIGSGVISSWYTTVYEPVEA